MSRAAFNIASIMIAAGTVGMIAAGAIASDRYDNPETKDVLTIAIGLTSAALFLLGGILAGLHWGDRPACCQGEGQEQQRRLLP